MLSQVREKIFEWEKVANNVISALTGEILVFCARILKQKLETFLVLARPG
jgi:hypothetical protein